MKLVALALVLSLASETQARAVIAERPAPDSLDQVKALATLYVIQMNALAKKVLSNLEGTSYDSYRAQLSKGLDELQRHALTATQSLEAYRAALAAQLRELTAQTDSGVLADVELFRSLVDPHRVRLQELLLRQANEFRAVFQPVLQEYTTKLRRLSDEMRPKLDPVRADFRARWDANAEEIKENLALIFEPVRHTAMKYVGKLNTMTLPYVDEYKQRLIKAAERLRTHFDPQAQDLQGTLQVYKEMLKKMAASFHETVKLAMDE